MEPVEQEIIRNPDGTFPKGVSGNPNGRPKGQSLKEFWRERFQSMTDEEKLEFTKKIGLDVIWRMSEGNPQNDVTSMGEKITVNLVSFDENSNNPTQL